MMAYAASVTLIYRGHHQARLAACQGPAQRRAVPQQGGQLGVGCGADPLTEKFYA